MRLAVLIFGCCACVTCSLAQDYRIRQFTVEDGLPSDIIKDISEDSLGFIWIACDEGLVKFDGFNFTPYKEALHSQYAKGFLRRSNKQLLAFADLDVVRIDNRLDTVVFDRVLSAMRNVTDSALWYPKSMFEDSDGNYWFGEPEAVSKWDGKRVQRYAFPFEESPIFLRSFTVFERNDEIYAIAFMGKAWHLDKARNEFALMPHTLPKEIADVKKVGQDFVLAAGDGLYKVNWDGELIASASKILDCVLTSSINPVNDSTWFVSTFGLKHYWMTKRNGVLTFDSFEQRVTNINRAFASITGDVWLASNEGVYVVQRHIFNTLSYPGQPGFIEGIAEDTNNNRLYFTNRLSLFSMDNNEDGVGTAKVVYTKQAGYFQGLQYHGNKLWATNQYDVLVFDNDTLVKEIDCSPYGRFIHDLFVDSSGEVWLSQANSNVVTSVTSDYRVHHHKIALTPGSNINVVRQGPRGIYAASNGKDGYLFLKEAGETDFKNVSLPVTFEMEGDFNITDIASCQGVLWLASTEGLLRYDHAKVQRINISEATAAVAIKSVEAYDEENILFANAYGLFLYNINSGEFWQYEESNGLPSNTILARGIFKDKFSKIWAGTAKGLAFSTRPLDERMPTPRPFCIAALVNGKDKRFAKGLEVPYNTFISLAFSSISLPVKRLTMEYRWNPEQSWKRLPDNKITFADLPSGIHVLEVRAKKTGSYDWSEPVEVRIDVGPPFWKRSWFIAGSMVTLLVVAWMAYAAAAAINKRRRAYLENLIAERTNEIKLINEELVQKNSELDRFVYSTSHDLSAPLKSILGLVTLSKMEDPRSKIVPYLDMMERSVRKLESFIKDVISYSRNARLPVKNEPINFDSLVQSLLDDHQFAPNFGGIEFNLSNERSTEIYSDETRLRIILNNLISNAIKFHDLGAPHKKPFIFIKASGNDGHLVLTVEDNGRGIHKEYVGHIFNMFFRATDSVQGSGLGLYIMKETVHKLGGTVEVTSELGVGTRFVVTFPQTKPVVDPEPHTMNSL